MDETSQVISEIEGATEDQLREIIEKWFETIRTSGMKIGAYFISAGVYAAIQKNLVKSGKVSLNDYRRCIKEISKLIEVQLKTQQNDSEEVEDDGRAENFGDTNS